VPSAAPPVSTEGTVSGAAAASLATSPPTADYAPVAPPRRKKRAHRKDLGIASCGAGTCG
jgi:hypothetical protein